MDRTATQFVLLMGGLVLVLAVVASSRAGAQPPTEENPAGSSSSASSEDSKAAGRGLFEIVFSGGWIGACIVLTLVGLSLAAGALVVEHAYSIREVVLIPPAAASEVGQALARGDFLAAENACRQRPSFLTAVFLGGLAERDGGWPAIEKGLEDALAGQAARIVRKIEYLSVIGNIAPMVGLLGTVTGMIFAFQEVAETQGAARAAELAAGIYQALVTTVGGLLVAIPSLAAFAVFRNRVDQCSANAAEVAIAAFRPLKRLRAASAGAPPVAPS